MRNYVLFLHGTYRSAELSFYKRLCRGRIKIAVDGGYSFFRRTGLVPDVLIGDFDSLKRAPKRLSARTEVLEFPKDKDETDSQLALEYCLERGAGMVDIVVPSVGEPDHFLGDFMLLDLAARMRPKVNARLVNFRYQVVLLEDSGIEFEGCPGHLVSVIPFAVPIELTCRGTEFDVPRAKIGPGEGRAMRNRIAAAKAGFSVSGKAFVIHQFNL
jgi:thiamine pyrophosphokinase